MATNNLSNKRWLSPVELEAEYGFSQSWQSKKRMLSSSSNFPFHRIGGKFIFYAREEIDAWIEEHKVQ